MDKKTMDEKETRENLWNTLLHWLYSDNFIIFGVKLGNKWKTIIANRDSKKILLKSKQCTSYKESMNSMKCEVDGFIDVENAIGGENDRT